MFRFVLLAVTLASALSGVSAAPTAAAASSPPAQDRKCAGKFNGSLTTFPGSFSVPLVARDQLGLFPLLNVQKTGNKKYFTSSEGPDTNPPANSSDLFQLKDGVLTSLIDSVKPFAALNGTVSANGRTLQKVGFTANTKTSAVKWKIVGGCSPYSGNPPVYVLLPQDKKSIPGVYYNGSSFFPGLLPANTGANTEKDTVLRADFFASPQKK